MADEIGPNDVIEFIGIHGPGNRKSHRGLPGYGIEEIQDDTLNFTDEEFETIMHQLDSIDKPISANTINYVSQSIRNARTTSDQRQILLNKYMKRPSSPLDLFLSNHSPAITHYDEMINKLDENLQNQINIIKDKMSDAEKTAKNNFDFISAIADKFIDMQAFLDDCIKNSQNK